MGIDNHAAAAGGDGWPGFHGPGQTCRPRPAEAAAAGIIAAAQKVEHYEIATYGTLVAFAGTLGEVRVAEILKETLIEEKNADSTLTDAAYNNINFEAEQADEE